MTDGHFPLAELRLVRAQRVPRLVAKRAFDLAVASVLLVIFSPALLIVFVLVRATSPGRALFRQTRVGRYGTSFTIYKFRTMRAGCSDEIHRAYIRELLTSPQPRTGGAGGRFKLEDDPRVTCIGRVLRRTSLDELPQLLNVIRGDMSLVGPRPALPWEAELFGPAHHARFLVPPGVTGLWQVSGRSRLTMRQGLDLDLEYVERRSFLLDLVILAKTVPAVLGAGDAS